MQSIAAVIDYDAMFFLKQSLLNHIYIGQIHETAD